MSNLVVPTRLSFILLAIGLAMLLCSLAALAYTFAPVDILQARATLVPTMLAPP